MFDSTQQRLEKYLRESESLKREALRQRKIADECREDVQRLIAETMDVWRAVQSRQSELRAQLDQLRGATRHDQEDRDA